MESHGRDARHCIVREKKEIILLEGSKALSARTSHPASDSQSARLGVEHPLSSIPWLLTSLQSYSPWSVPSDDRTGVSNGYRLGLCHIHILRMYIFRCHAMIFTVMNRPYVTYTTPMWIILHALSHTNLQPSHRNGRKMDDAKFQPRTQGP